MKKTTLLVFVTAVLTLATYGQTTEFTFQGSLRDGGGPVNGDFDLEFALFDAVSGGTQLGGTLSRPAVAVAAGRFTVRLDFGNQFPGATRFIEIRVRQTGQPAFTTLSPRQPLASIPYAVKTLNADNATTATNAINATSATSATTATTATNALNLGGIAANQFVVTTDARLSDARLPAPGSGSYIQNQNAVTQASSNFAISGTGSANIFNVSTQFDLANVRLLSANGTRTNIDGTVLERFSNTFVGEGAGASSTPNPEPLSFGGKANTFLGFRAGTANTLGQANTYIGFQAGQLTTTNSGNTFIGSSAGQVSQGNSNVFVGSASGNESTTGGENSFFGSNSGGENTTGSRNSFIGVSAGNTNVDGNGNTVLGSYADVGAGTLLNATAIGGRALVTQSNALVLGAISGVNGCSGINGCDSVNVGIGTTAPADRLDVDGDIRVGTGTTGCVKDSDGTVIAGTCSSDERLKRNVTSFSNLLNSFVRLRPVHYFWRVDEFKEKHFGTRQSFGLIAQEVETYFPDLVVSDEQGMKAVNYSKLPLLTIQAVKELKAENDQLREQIEKQNEVLRKQQSEVDELKTLVCAANAGAVICQPSQN